LRRVIYLEIAESLRQSIASGDYSEGQLLPSEASLGELHGASRVTIRKALEVLRSEGLVESRQGVGWMVAADPIPQSLDALVSIERQLAASGRASQREIIDFGFVTPPPDVVEVLGSNVLEVRRINLADGQPFARVTVWCREDLGVELSRAQVARHSFHDLLPARAKEAVQRIGAEPVTAADGELLDVPPGSAALVVRRTTIDDQGEPILMSELCFPGHLTEFVAQLSRALPEEAGGGLRLVGDE
jgi:GntR family transcriptional regulator